MSGFPEYIYKLLIVATDSESRARMTANGSVKRVSVGRILLHWFGAHYWDAIAADYEEDEVLLECRICGVQKWVDD